MKTLLFDLSTIVDRVYRRYHNHGIPATLEQVLTLVRAGVIDIIEQDHIRVTNQAHRDAMIRGHDRRLKLTPQDHYDRPLYGYCAHLLEGRINILFKDHPALIDDDSFWDWTNEMIWTQWKTMVDITPLNLNGHVVTYSFNHNYLVLNDYGDARILEWSIEHAR